MPPLRLAVDARVIAEDVRGIGRYARAVLRRMAILDDVELTLLADGPFPQRRRRAYAQALESERFSVRSHASGELDLIWHPANGTFFSSRLPAVATIHDAVPFRFPDPDGMRREHAQRPFLRSARGAARIVTVSQFARAELHELLDIPFEKIAVIPHGVDGSFTPGSPQPLPEQLHGREFLLFVGDPIAEPRKNFALLYDAYRRAWPAGNGPVLAVAGPHAPELPGVIRLGALVDDLVGNADSALRACYRGAIALVLASYHETFGMPMLEAMACGTPVVASSSSALPEIAGDAALYVPPHDTHAWAAALQRIVEDFALRERLTVNGLRRARAFSWDESVTQHLRVFRAVVAG